MEGQLVNLHNEHLSVTACSKGAELYSVQLDGHEYIWSGDPAYWGRHTPVLFPFVGRLFEDRYTVCGKEYSMKRHGFSQNALFAVAGADDTHVVFGLTASEDTKAVFPYEFSFRVVYELDGQTVKVSYIAENRSGEEMHFGLGAHPGFCCPMEEGLSFEDYVIEFPEKCLPDQIGWSENVLVSGKNEFYPLEDGRRLPLRHDLFTFDAIVLTNCGDSCTIRSDKGTRSVTVSYPQMPYVGFWHAVNTDAPYVCVEPWVSLPAREGVVEEFSARRDLVHLPAGETYTCSWSIRVE